MGHTLTQAGSCTPDGTLSCLAMRGVHGSQSNMLNERLKERMLRKMIDEM